MNPETSDHVPTAADQHQAGSPSEIHNRQVMSPGGSDVAPGATAPNVSHRYILRSSVSSRQALSSDSAEVNRTSEEESREEDPTIHEVGQRGFVMEASQTLREETGTRNVHDVQSGSNGQQERPRAEAYRIVSLREEAPSPIRRMEAYMAEIDYSETSGNKIEKLKGITNWPNWKTNIRFKLIEKDYDEVVYGVKPTDVDDAVWARKGMKAAAIIGMNIERAQQALVPDLSKMTGREIMEAYKRIYDTNDQASQLAKRFAFLQLSMKNDENVVTWISRVENAAANCTEAGVDVSKEMIPVMLNGLTEAYATVKTVILTTSSTLELTDVTTKLINYEAANMLGTKETALAATHRHFTTPNTNNKSRQHAHGTCMSCGRTGCICYWCQKANHHSTDCRNKKAGKPKVPKSDAKQSKDQGTNRKPKVTQGKKTNDDNETSPPASEANAAEEEVPMFHAEESHLASTNRKKWLLDSGASCHMVADKKWFKKLEQIDPISIIFGGEGSTADAVGRGDVTVHNYVNGKMKQITFTDVLYVPDARHHLISTTALVEKGATILFKKGIAKATFNNRDLLEARNSGKLWELRIAPEIMHAYSAEAASEAVDIWHQRLGHVNANSLEETMKLYRVPFPKVNNMEHCIGCVLGKSVKSPFRMTDERATKPFEMIHTDISGPFREPTPSGANYFAIVVDDYTKYIKVQPISNKDHARLFLQDYIKTIHQQTLYKVQTVRSDNDSVYCSKEAEAWFKQQGIHHQITVPYSPQSNGVAERNIRTVKEMANAMIHNASIKFNLNDPALWGEAVKHAAHILNNTYKQDLRTTPSQKVWGKLPEIGSYRVWGCPAWIHLDPAQRKGGTWAPKREQGIHVGFAEGVKGYRIYYPDKATQWKFSAARDVTFLERPQTSATYGPNALLAENLGEGTHHSKLPQTYKQAVSGPDSAQWLQAMEEEMASIQEKGTYTLTDLPEGRQAIGCRWVFAIKPELGDTPPRYKARLVAQGFSQMPGLDYGETFAPVARYGSLRIFLAIAASRNYELTQADVVTAFLNGTLNEELYMKQPPGFEEKSKPNQVCRLIKSLYGLKQAGRVWTDKLRVALTSLKFNPIAGDDCIYANSQKDAFIITYVDDLLIASSSKKKNDYIIKYLGQSFKLKSLGEPRRFLGLDIERDRSNRTIKLSLAKYSDKVLTLMNMEKANPVSTPMTPNVKLVPADEDHVDITTYQRCIGSLMFMVTTMRPDMAYAVGSLAMFASQPGQKHLNELKHLLRYVKGTKYMQLVLGGRNLNLHGFTDASYADNWNAKSTEGYVFYLGNYPVSWASRKQKIVALSTTEAEYIATTEGVKEAIWLKTVLAGFGEAPGSIEIAVDNRSSLALAHNPEFHARTKHINVRHHFIREMILKKQVKLAWTSSETNPADIMTKSLPRDKIQNLRKVLELTLGGSVESARNSKIT